MKTLTTAVDTALQSPNVPLLLLTELDFDSGTVRLCNAPYDFAWNGFTWIGAANFGQVQEIPEASDLSMAGIAMSISGINPALVSTALTETYQGRTVILRLAPMDSNYHILVDPVIVFQGRMDVMTISMAETATISVTAESRLTDWNRSPIRRYNNEDQQAEFSGDLFFEFVPQMVQKEILWGVPSAAVPAPAPIIAAGNPLLLAGPPPTPSTSRFG